MELPAQEADQTPVPQHVKKGSAVGPVPAADRGDSWGLELSGRGAGGDAGGASQLLQRTGFTQCFGHAASGKYSVT